MKKRKCEKLSPLCDSEDRTVKVLKRAEKVLKKTAEESPQFTVGT